MSRPSTPVSGEATCGRRDVTGVAVVKLTDGDLSDPCLHHMLSVRHRERERQRRKDGGRGLDVRHTVERERQIDRKKVPEDRVRKTG